MALIGEQTVQRLAKGRAGDPVLRGERAAGGGLPIADCEQDKALVSAEAVPQRLKGVSGLLQRQVEGKCGGVVLSRSLLEDVAEVVGKQDRSLWMAARVGEQSIHRSTWLKSLGGEQALDVLGGLGKRQGRKLERSRLTVEGPLVLGEEGVHEGGLTAGEDVSRGI